MIDERPPYQKKYMVEVSDDKQTWIHIGEATQTHLDMNRLPQYVCQKIAMLQPNYYRVRDGPRVISQVQTSYGMMLEKTRTVDLE